MNYNYTELMHKTRMNKEQNYSYDKKEECEKANEIYEYMNNEYPILTKTINKKYVPGGPTDKVKKEVFSVLLLYFCKLASKDVSIEFKNLVQKEVELVNEILKKEPEWFYNTNCNFYNKGDYKVTIVDYINKTEKCTGTFSALHFTNLMYDIVKDEHSNLEEANRFYYEYYNQLNRLHKVIERKKTILDEIYNMPNIDNILDKEVLKVIAVELGANIPYNAYDFLVKNNKKTVVSKVKTKVKKIIGTK